MGVFMCPHHPDGPTIEGESCEIFTCECHGRVRYSWCPLCQRYVLAARHLAFDTKKRGAGR